MATLLIPLVGPLQAWGLDAKFDLRQTAPEPSKSAAIGLLCCCLGRDRSESLEDLAAMPFGVRVDREGSLLRDFHTVQDVIAADGSKVKTLVSNRWYLTDAAMLIGFQSDDRDLVKKIHQALQHPHWTPCLGRRSCLPTVPLAAGGVVNLPLLEALQQAERLVAGDKDLRAVIEDSTGTQQRPDQPLAPFSKRLFGIRRVRTLSIKPCLPST
mgnify:CR=1 FL=1